MWRPRHSLNRADPRLAGQRLTWFPLDGSLSNHGNTGGRLPDLPSGGWTTTPGVGRGLILPGTSTSSNAGTGVTGASMGIQGSTPRTVILEYTHQDANVGVPLFGMGNPVGTEDFTFLKNGYTDFKVNLWGYDWTFPISGGFGDYTNRVVITWNGRGFVAYVRSLKNTSTGNASTLR